MPRSYFPPAVLCVGVLAGPAGAQAPATDAACARRTAYAVASVADTIGTGWVALTDSSFASEVHAVAQGALLRLDGRRAPDGLVPSMRVRIWRAAADSAGPPTQDGDVRFGPAEVVATVTAAGRGTQEQRVAVPPGSMPYMANVPLFVALLAARVRVAGADSVPTYWLFSGEPADAVVAERGPRGIAALRFPGQRFDLQLAPDGLLLAAENASIGNPAAPRVRTVRVPNSACR